MSKVTTPTSATLLEKLVDLNDAAAWDRFYRVYAPFIVGNARQRGCNETEAKDVLQECMLRLMQAMPTFRYDRSRGQFRAYLYFQLLAAIRRVRRQNQVIGPNGAVVVPLNPQDGEIPGGNNAPGAEMDREWDKYLLALAMENVRKRTSDSVWQAFIKHKLEGRTAKEVAELLGVTESNVYTPAHRIVAAIRREFLKLKTELGEE